MHQQQRQRPGTDLTGSPSYAPRILITGDPGSGCSDNQYAQFNTAAFAVPTPSATNPSLGFESGRNYLRGCADHTLDMAIARNFRSAATASCSSASTCSTSSTRSMLNARSTTLQVPARRSDAEQHQYDAAGNLVQRG